jgi:hypothetical protein
MLGGLPQLAGLAALPPGSSHLPAGELAQRDAIDQQPVLLLDTLGIKPGSSNLFAGAHMFRELHTRKSKQQG